MRYRRRSGEAAAPPSVGKRGRPRIEAAHDELVLLGLGVALVLVAVVVRRRGRVEPGRGVLQRKAHVVELLLDLLDGFGAEVSDVEEVLLAARDELAHGVDALALEAVVGPDREVQLLD